MDTENFTVEDLKSMMRGKRMYKIFPFPGQDKKIAVKMLPQSELDDAEFQARIWLDEKLEKRDDTGKVIRKIRPDEGTLTLAIRRYLIYRFTIHVPTEEEASKGEFRRFFDSPDQVVELLTVDQLIILTEYYNELQEEVSPIKQLKNYEDFEKLITEIKKKSIGSLFLNTFELTALVDFMVANPISLLKASGVSPMLLKDLEQKLKKNNSKKQEKKQKKTPKNSEEAEEGEFEIKM